MQRTGCNKSNIIKGLLAELGCVRRILFLGYALTPHTEVKNIAYEVLIQCGAYGCAAYGRGCCIMENRAVEVIQLAFVVSIMACHIGAYYDIRRSLWGDQFGD